MMVVSLVRLFFLWLGLPFLASLLLLQQGLEAFHSQVILVVLQPLLHGDPPCLFLLCVPGLHISFMGGSSLVFWQAVTNFVSSEGPGRQGREEECLLFRISLSLQCSDFFFNFFLIFKVFGLGQLCSDLLANTFDSLSFFGLDDSILKELFDPLRTDAGNFERLQVFLLILLLLFRISCTIFFGQLVVFILVFLHQLPFHSNVLGSRDQQAFQSFCFFSKINSISACGPFRRSFNEIGISFYDVLGEVSGLFDIGKEGALQDQSEHGAIAQLIQFNGICFIFNQARYINMNSSTLPQIMQKCNLNPDLIPNGFIWINLRSKDLDVGGLIKNHHFPLLFAPFFSSLGFSLATSTFLSFLSFLSALVSLDFDFFSSLGVALLPLDLSPFLPTFTRSLTSFQSSASTSCLVFHSSRSFLYCSMASLYSVSRAFFSFSGISSHSPLTLLTRSGSSVISASLSARNLKQALSGCLGTFLRADSET